MTSAVLSDNTIKAADELFDPSVSNKFHLSLVLDESSLRSSVFDPDTQKFLALESDQGSWIELLRKSDLRKCAFKSVSASLVHCRNTLVPDSIFEQEKRHDLFYFHHSKVEGEKIHSDRLEQINARNLFSIPAQSEQILKDTFPGIQIYHASTPFLASRLLTSGKVELGIFVEIYDSCIQVVVMRKGELQLCNVFSCQEPEEVAYYILYVYEQLKLDPDQLKLHVSGNITRDSEIHTILYKYIRKVEFIKTPAAFKYSYKFNELPLHRFYSLFAQSLLV